MKTRFLTNKYASLLIAISLISAYSFVCMTKNCFSAAMVFIVDEGYMTKLQTGIISGCFYVVYALMQIFGGVVVDKWNPERFITLGMLGAALANIGVYFCYENYALTLLIWAVNAVVQFGVWPATFKLISTFIATEHRYRALTIVTLSNPMGVTVGYLVAALVGKWQYNFLVSGIGLILLALIWEIAFHSIKKNIYVDDAQEQTFDSFSHRARTHISFFKLSLNAGLILILIVAFTRTAIEQAKSLIPTMIKESYTAVDPTFATTLNIIVLGCAALGPLLGNSLRKIFRNEFVAITTLLTAALPFAIVPLWVGKINYWIIVASISVVILLASAAGFFTTTYLAVSFAQWGKDGTVAGLLNALSSLGFVAVLFGLTAIAEFLGWRITWLFIILMLLIAMVLSSVETPIWHHFKEDAKEEAEANN